MDDIPRDDPFPTGPMELPGEPDRTESPQPSPTPPRGGFSRNKIVLVVLGLILLVAIGFGMALLLDKKEAATPTTNTEQTTDSSQSQSVNSDVPEASVTKTFKADFPRVEFTYPENWVATENIEQESIRIESPEFTYTSINGGAVNGNFRVFIRQGARQAESKYIGRGVAALPSEKLPYTNPPAGQRPETNLSFFGLDTDDNFAFFLIAGNFSLQKGESLGPDYGKEPETYIITGGYSTKELTDDLATNPVPLEYFGTTNAYKQSIEILKSLKLL